jgi:hypothetical protein
MHAVLEAQRLALGAMQQVCAQRPGVHAHQLLALERELGLCASATGLADYQRKAGGGFELARAAWLDRVAGRFRSLLALGDRYAARAALLEYRGALAAHDLSDWTEALQAAALAAAPWRERAAQAGSSLTRTLLNLLLHHSCTPPGADHWGDAVGAWHALSAADPAAARALRFGAKWPARVAPRLPWCDGAARIWLQRLLADLPALPVSALDSALGSEPDDENADADLATELLKLSDAWRRSLSDAAASPSVPAPLADPAGCAASASADQALTPWRQLAEPAPGASPATVAMTGVARRLLALAAGASSGPDVQRFAVESGLLTELAAAPLRLRLAEIEERQGAWPQPLLAAHTRTLRTALSQAGTATELELLSTHADACLDIEADWQSLFFAAQLAPLGAALNFAISPAESARGLRGASAISRNLLGQAAAATLQGVLVQAVVQQHRVSGSPEQGSDAVAWRGEAGHGPLPLLRAWCAVAASRGAAVPADGAGLLAALQQLAGLCLDPKPAVAPVRVQLWGVQADALEAAQLLAAPCRPALPLWQEQDLAGGAV